MYALCHTMQVHECLKSNIMYEGPSSLSQGVYTDKKKFNSLHEKDKGKIATNLTPQPPPEAAGSWTLPGHHRRHDHRWNKVGLTVKERGECYPWTEHGEELQQSPPFRPDLECWGRRDCGSWRNDAEHETCPERKTRKTQRCHMVKAQVNTAIHNSRRVGLGTTVEYIERKFKTKD